MDYNHSEMYSVRFLIWQVSEISDCVGKNGKHGSTPAELILHLSASLPAILPIVLAPKVETESRKQARCFAEWRVTYGY